MAWRFKVSKYKNAAPRFPKREDQILEVPVGQLMQSCGNHITASCSYIAFNVDSGGGGNVGVLPLDATGRIGQMLPTLRAHADYVTDVVFSRFHDDTLATCSADNTVKIWKLPETERLSEHMSSISPSANILAGKHRVETLAWNPVADGVLAAAVHNSVKVYDITSLSEKYDLSSHTDQIQSLSWHGNGSFLVTSCKDKKLRIFDTRSSLIAQECIGHDNNKDTRALWLGDQDFIISTGFNTVISLEKNRQRELKLWDSRKFDRALKAEVRDTSNGTLMPFFDEDTNMLLVVGKTDTSWSYLEVITAEPYFIQNAIERTERNEQIKGACLIPKLAVNVMEGEVDRLLLLLQNSIVPLPYIIPRRQYTEFHADLFPDTKCMEAALSTDQWFAGENAQVSKVSLNPAQRKSQKKIQPEAKKDEFVKEIKTDISQKSESSTGNSRSSMKSSTTETESPSVDISREPSKAAKSFAALHQSKCKYLKGTTLHASTHIVNIRRLCRTLPGQSNLFCANTKRCAVPLEGAGGLIAILELDKPGRLPDTGVPVLQNSSKVNDFMFDPFNVNRILVGCDNAKVYIWSIPEDGLTETLTEYDSYLMSHTEKIYFVRFNPVAKDVVLTAAYDMKIKIWDLADNTEQIEVSSHMDEIFCAEWSPDGKLVATVCKDGKVRIFEPRKSTEPIKEGPGSTGSRGARVIWTINMKYLLVSGFDKNSFRTLSIYSADSLDAGALFTEILDVSPSILVPQYDEGTSTVFLTGRGDGVILCYEVSEEYPHLYPLSPIKPENLHQGLVLLPKTVCDVKKVEIARLLRLTQSSVEPISVTVPRVKPAYFQDDLFPDTVQPGVPTVTSQEWFNHVDRTPIKLSLRPADMTLLSEAPVEAPKERKYDSYNPDTFKTDEMKKEELLSAMTNKLDLKDEPLPQDEAEGVDSDEWENY